MNSNRRRETMSFEDTGYHVGKISVDSGAKDSQSNFENKEKSNSNISTTGWGKAPTKLKSMSFTDIVEKEKDNEQTIDEEYERKNRNNDEDGWFQNRNSSYRRNESYDNLYENTRRGSKPRTVHSKNNEFYDNSPQETSDIQPKITFIVGSNVNNRPATPDFRPPSTSKSFYSNSNNSSFSGNKSWFGQRQQPSIDEQPKHHEQKMKQSKSFDIGVKFPQPKLQDQTQNEVKTTEWKPSHSNPQ